MQNDNTKSLVHLHFLIFLWGFTSILGALIDLDSMPIVWYRMTIASALIAVYFLLFSPKSFQLHKGALKYYMLGGLLISVHWVLFFYAIKISSISLTLSILSSASLMTSILEPLIYKRSFRLYEIFFGLFVIFGLYLIFGVQKENLEGIVVALICTLLSVLFSLLNGKLIQYYPANNISFYQLITGAIVISFAILFNVENPASLIQLSWDDWLWLFLLSSVCTAYATIGSVVILKHVTPFTMMLSLNLEPVYGILFSLWIFGEQELMSTQFYIGVLIILGGVVGNGIYKRQLKKNSPP
ncbi:DMT family transporter [Flavobacteriaceae bacterium]|nr:DMT family transporter [Flavobacteriaceae bacterium]